MLLCLNSVAVLNYFLSVLASKFGVGLSIFKTIVQHVYQCFQQPWFQKYFSHRLFPQGFNKSLFKIYKPWIKPTSYMVKHNITNFDLKQKKYLKIGQKHKFKTVNEGKNYSPVKH